MALARIRSSDSIDTLGANPAVTPAAIDGRKIQQELAKVLQLFDAGSNDQSFLLLTKITESVVLNLTTLGLFPDDPSPPPGIVNTKSRARLDRLLFWKALNEVWLYGISCAMSSSFSVELSFESGNTSPLSESSADFAKRQHPPLKQKTTNCPMRQAEFEDLKKQIVKYSDILEVFGLVDYEMGLWESSIIELLDHAIFLSSQPPPFSTNRSAPGNASCFTSPTIQLLQTDPTPAQDSALRSCLDVLTSPAGGLILGSQANARNMSSCLTGLEENKFAADLSTAMNVDSDADTEILEDN